MFASKSSFWGDRLKASGIHLGISLVIAALAALLVFGVWYPYPYREISGGRELFLLVVVVDVILGPLITLAIFNRSKPWPVLRRDLTVVAVLQFGALAYGLWAVFVARPVHIVFEYDRFRVVQAVDVLPEFLAKAPPTVNALPIFGPSPLSLRPFLDETEKMEATVAAVQGVSLSSRPELWQTYEVGKPDVLKVAKPAALLKARFASQSQNIDAVLAKANRTAENTAYVPLAGRKSFWTVFLDPQTAEIVAYMPLDSF